jgi:hypothetical protein
MTKIWLTVAVASGLLCQTATSSRPIPLGPTGDQLSTDDLAQIARISGEAGGKPWVLVGHPPGLVESARWFVDVYLEADRTVGVLRRGRIQVVTALLPSIAAYAAPKTWQRVSSAEYAQAPIPGANPAELTGSRDLNRPFRVHGTLSDEALLSIVSFVRSSPATPPPDSRTPGQIVPRILLGVEGTWPIERVVARDDTTVEVSLIDLEPTEKSGQKLMLRGAGTGWTVERVFLWIAD